MSKATVDILEDFQNSFEYELKVTGFTSDENGTYIAVEDTLYARVFMSITVESVEYMITEVDFGAITIAEVIDIVGVVTLQKPFYFHGTPYATNAKLTGIQNWKHKTPFFYVFEMLKEKEYNETFGGAVEKESSLVVLFMDGYDERWTTDEHYEFTINRMRELWHYFRSEMKSYSGFIYSEIDSFTVINHAKFGEYFEKKGYKNSIFSEKISGVEVRFDLPIATETGCI